MPIEQRKVGFLKNLIYLTQYEGKVSSEKNYVLGMDQLLFVFSIEICFAFEFVLLKLIFFPQKETVHYLLFVPDMYMDVHY